jgi:tRNA(Ile)-lysidine synthase
VAHLDHQLRPESASEAVYVREVTEHYGHPFELKKANLSEGSGSLEELSRLERYRFLVEVAHKYGIRKLAVGHTFDDQVETILMHFLRGAGPSGLRGILPETSMTDWRGIPNSKDCVIVRPLLSIRHAEASALCEQVKLEPRFDRSNQDQTFFRNRIRHHLLPILEEYNPGIHSVVYRLGEIMRAEAEFLEDQIEQTWEQTAIKLEGGGIILHVEPFEKRMLALQRGIARRAILELRPNLRDIGFDHIDGLIEFTLNPNRSASKSLIDDLLMYNYGEDVLLASRDASLAMPDFPQMRDLTTVECPASGDIQLAHGWKISMRQLEDVDFDSLLDKGGDAWEVYIDRDQLSSPLIIRHRQPGDRIQPLGMQGSVKISDLMINRKIPQLARSLWPLVVSGDQILWIPGIHLAHTYRVTEETEKLIHMMVHHPEEGGTKN